MTLKQGVENLLCHYIPEVKQVEAERQNMRKRLFGQNIKFLKFFDQKNLGSLPRIFICSIILILFFYSMPQIIDFTNEYKC